MISMQKSTLLLKTKIREGKRKKKMKGDKDIRWRNIK